MELIWCDDCCLFMRLIDGPHMTSGNQSNCLLTDEQILELVYAVTEQFGTGLSGNELVESIRLVMEDVPGIEMESTQEIHCVVNQIRILYHDQYKDRNKN